MLYTQHKVGKLFYIVKDEKSKSRLQVSLHCPLFMVTVKLFRP